MSLRPHEAYCRACGSVVMKAAAFCFTCSVSNPGVPDQPVASARNLSRRNDRVEHDARLQRRLDPPAAALLVVAGSALGLPGIFVSESFALFVGPWLSAPVIEELLKPFGVYLLLARWPATVHRQVSIAALCGLAGLAFGLMESALFVYVYVEDAGGDYALFRFTVPVALHVTASTILGLGVNRREFAALGRGEFLSMRSWPFTAAAMVLHATYNIVVTVIEFI